MLEEIATRVRARQEADGGVLPPLLLLGVMERVGSNWVSDTLRPVTGQHNEPFRQQLSLGHPLSALSPHAASLADAAPRLGLYGRHWLVTFTVSKYAPVRQVVKETNLFFALPALLALFPDAPVAVLARSPLGVASSFTRGDLFRRWDYAARYQQMLTVTSRPEHCRWAGVVPDDDPPDLVALARLQILNTLLLANELHGRGEDGGLVVIRYETAVLDPDAARGWLARVVPEAPGFAAAPGEVAGEDTFATIGRKTGLTACLDQPATEAVRAATAQALAAGRRAVPVPAWDLAQEWQAAATCIPSHPGRDLAPGRRPAARLKAAAGPARSGGFRGEAAVGCCGGTCWSAMTSSPRSSTSWPPRGCRTATTAVTCSPARCRTSGAGGCTLTRAPAGGRSAPDSATTPPTG